MLKAIRFVLPLVALLLAPTLFAENLLNLQALTNRAAEVNTTLFPDADDVLLDSFEQVEYQPDGTSSTITESALKILTEKGKRSNLTITLYYDIAYGRDEFTFVQLVKPDGSIVPIDIEAQSKEMIDPSQMQSNIYNPKSKVLQLSVPGLEVGDILHYGYREEETKTRVPDTWSDYQVIEYTSPILHGTYRIIAPKERPLANIAHKAEVPGTLTFSEEKSEQEDHIVYTWELNNVPRMFSEPNMPSLHTVVQRLLVSTIDKWEDLSKWYWDLCRPHLEATTPEMEAKTKELVEGCTNTLDKINAVFTFVSQDIRYMGITTEEEAPGYEPHDACMTFTNRYGVCRDKAALLASMLRLVDIEAFPVIIMSGPKKDEEVPQPFFNHAVTAALGDNGEYILMDSTDENTKDIFPSYLQNMSYLVARPEGETLRTSPVIPAEKNLLKIATAGKLDADGNLKGQSTLVFEGINDTTYRGYFSRIKPVERKRFFEGKLKRSMPTVTLDTVEILPKELRDTTQPLTIKLAFSADNLLIEGAEKKMLSLPRLSSSLGYANFLIGQTGLESRKYPLYTRVTAGIQETLDLEIPADLGELNIPGYETIDTDQLDWNLHVEQLNGRLVATNSFLLNTVEFSPEQYLVLKDNLKDIEYNLRKKLILDPPSANPLADSDVRIIEQSSEVVLETPSRWTESFRSKTEILTYAGKKAFSDLKFSYNPAWQTIELTYARVIHPDGTIKEVSDKEINIMDANWAASAPRYPAAKRLIANLPSVEIGSIIEYEIVSKVDGKPFFSTTQIFNGHDPIEQKSFTLTAPADLKIETQNNGIAESINRGTDTITYHWSATNQPAVKKEEKLPAWWSFNPALFISTGNWPEYADTIRAKLTNATRGQPNTVNLAQTLTNALETEREKIIALRDWVAMNLKEVAPGLAHFPLSNITPADLTLQDRYGNNADRMIVLYTLLEAAGFQPEFVLSGPISEIPEISGPKIKTPQRDLFTKVLIRLALEEETLFLSGSSQYAELGTSPYHRRPLLDLASGELDNVRVASGKDDQDHATFELNIAANGNVGMTISALRQGTAFEGFHRKYAEITPENRRRHYLELVSGISQSAKAVSELKTDFTSYPGNREFSIAADRYAVVDGDYLYFTIPGGLNGLLRYYSNERTLPLAWNSHIDKMLEYNIVLPEGYEPVILPKNLSWQAPGGAGLIEIFTEYSPRANAIRMVQMADLKPAFIPAEEFPQIIETSRKLSHPDMRTILLRKKK